MNSVNVKKTLLFEGGSTCDSKHRLFPHEFSVFKEQISFLAEVSKSQILVLLLQGKRTMIN